MSKKKHEKKPLSKKVIALLDQLKRKHGVRELARRFLIVCEDGKSAPNYFRALRKSLGLTATSIEVAGSDGRTQPVQVVARAIQLKKAASDGESGTVPFDQVWCVIDGDFGDKINNARTMQMRMASSWRSPPNASSIGCCCTSWKAIHRQWIAMGW